MKYEFEEYRPTISDEELIEDLKRIATDTQHPLSSAKYQVAGKYDVSTISRRFGSWTHALELAGIKADTTNRQHSKEELFSNIERVWIAKGKQPVRSDMNNKKLSTISSGSYLRRFSTWNNALREFVSYINSEDNAAAIATKPDDSSVRKDTRDVNLRIRFRVMQRDNFKCCVCGASPAKDPSVVLHVDHIIPWSKGGKTELDNLQTLCSNCNYGKSDIL